MGNRLPERKVMPPSIAASRRNEAGTPPSTRDAHAREARQGLEAAQLEFRPPTSLALFATGREVYVAARYLTKFAAGLAEEAPAQQETGMKLTTTAIAFMLGSVAAASPALAQYNS